MFSVKTEVLLNMSDGFNHVQGILDRQYEELQGVISRLGELSDMEGVIFALRRAGESIAELRKCAGQMDTALNDIVRLYENSDNYVSDEYDNANVHMKPSRVSDVDFKKFTTLLYDIPIEF